MTNYIIGTSAAIAVLWLLAEFTISNHKTWEEFTERRKTLFICSMLVAVFGILYFAVLELVNP